MNVWDFPKPFPPKGCVIAILDASFQTITSEMVQVRNAELASMDEARGVLADGHLHSLSSGDILISFTPYIDKLHPLAKFFKSGAQQIITKLHIDVLDGSQLHSWVDRSHFRELVDNLPNPLAPILKNLGFVDLGEKGLLALLQIHPMRTALLDPKKITSLEEGQRLLQHEMELTEHLNVSDLREYNASAVSSTPYIKQLYFEQAWNALPMPEQPWKTVLYWHRTRTENASLHNGPDPIWIDELQQYLGVGHFKRGSGDSASPHQHECNQTVLPNQYIMTSTNHHYSHLFFTMSSSLPVRLERIGTTEFCMLSDRRNAADADCDSIQFVSSLLRDGDYLHVGYGVLDTNARVMILKIEDILSSLRQL
jgi:hypothetical protein